MLGGAALAADLPARRAAPAPMFAAVPAFTWTGLYMGISGGGFFGDEGEITTTGVLAGNIAAVAANARPQRVSIDNEGFLIGGTLGYNMQFGSFVFGVEGDISYTDNESETTAFNPTAFGGGPAGSISSTFRTEMDYFATVRGRAGFAFGNVLVYGTGGLAIADVNMTADFNAPNFGSRQFLGERSETLTGYTVGGGVEFALPTNILPFLGSAVTLKAEYLYYDLGEETINVPAVGAGGVGAYNSRFENEGHIVRGGINVKFGTF
jgi:outer membrane immunogenic protein